MFRGCLLDGLGLGREEHSPDLGKQMLEDEFHSSIQGVIANDQAILTSEEDPADDGLMLGFQIVLAEG